jgi:O-antigen/teichoic acid export membrane protein
VYLLQSNHRLRSFSAKNPLARELAHNSTLAALSFLYDLFCVGVANILLAHALGPGLFGQYGSTQALVAVIYGFTNLGVQVTSNRQIARSPELTNLYLGSCLAIRLIISLPLTIFVAIPLGAVLHVGAPPLLLLWCLYVSIAGLSGLILGAIQAANQFTSAAFVAIGSRTLWGFVLVAAIAQTHSLAVLLAALCTAQIGALGMAVWALAKTGKSARLHWNVRLWRRIVRSSLPVALAGSAESINLRADTILLAAISGSLSAGIYSAAYTLYYVGIVPGYAVTLGAFPTLSRVAAQSRARFHRLIGSLSLLGGLIGAGCALTLILCAGLLVEIAYSAAFRASVPEVQILACAIPFVVLNRLLVQALNASDRQRWTFYATGFGALCNIALNLLLIRIYGCLGAAVTTVFTEAAVLSIALVGISRPGRATNARLN